MLLAWLIRCCASLLSPACHVQRNNGRRVLSGSQALEARRLLAACTSQPMRCDPPVVEQPPLAPGGPGLSLPPATEQGEWLQYRGDRQLTGRSPLAGNIVAPEVLWTHDIGQVDQYWEVTLAEQAADSFDLEQSFPHGSEEEFDAYWQRQGDAYDLDGNGTLTTYPASLQFKIGDLLPEHPGLELVRFVTVEDNGSTLRSVGQLLVRQQGTWVQVWETEVIDNLFQAKVIVDDFDHDGQLEVAVAPHRYVQVYDMATGVLEYEADFMATGASSPRSYGWFGAEDLDGDGRQEFVLLGDFENFISVVGWQDGQLAKLWDHSIESGIANKQTIHHPRFKPLGDLDGDGSLELVTNIFNESGGGEWETVVYQGLTGEVLARLSKTYLESLADLDGDSRSELFVSRVEGSVTTATSVAILTYADGIFAELWNQPGAVWVSTEVRAGPLNINSSAVASSQQLAMFRTPTDATPTFLTQRHNQQTGGVELTAWNHHADDGFQPIATLGGTQIEVVAARESSFLIRTPFIGPLEANIDSLGLTANLQWSQRASLPATTAIAGRLSPHDTRPTLVVQGTGERLHAIGLDSRGQPQPVWQTSGRGVSTGSPLHTGLDGTAGPIMADLLGNGERQTVIATSGPQGQARLQALDPQGLPIWSLDFEGLPGASPQWNVGGLTTWVAGRFRDTDRDDLLVGIRRSTMHSEELRLIDGRTGEVIWTKTAAFEPSAEADVRGAGGNWLALVDYDGDGLDEAVNFYPDVFTIIDGDGTNLVQHSFNHDLFPGRQAFYATPVIADFLGDGSLTAYYAASAFETGLFQLDGTPIWTGPWHAGSPGILPAIGDFDGNGKLEIVSIGQQSADAPSRSEARAVDAATGTALWSLPLPGTPFNSNGGPTTRSPLPPVVADLDGDGRDEALFSIDKTLYALGYSVEAAGPAIEWELAFNEQLGVPALADMQGNGTLQIVVTSAAGRVYGVGQPVKIYQNQLNRFDVNGSGRVTLVDALAIVSELRRPTPSNSDSVYLDVSGDGLLTAYDVLEVVSEIRRQFQSIPFS